MAKFCTSLLSLFLTVAHGAIMVGDQHHTAASHFRSWYLWTVSVTEQKYQQLLKIFFSGGGGESWPFQGKYSSEWKGDADKKGQRPSCLTFCRAKAKEHHPGLEVSVSGGGGAQSPSQTSKTIICQFLLCRLSNASCSAHVWSPEEKLFCQKHITYHLSRGFSLHPPFSYLSNVSKWYDCISLKAKSIWLFPPSWIDEKFITILVMFVICLPFVDSSAEIYLTGSV